MNQALTTPSVPISPQVESSVVMTNAEWQMVLAHLRKAPFYRVASLIDKIVTQCIQQAMPQHANSPAE